MRKKNLKYFLIGVVLIISILNLAVAFQSQPQKEIVKVIRAYYQACQEENLDDYLKLMYLKDKALDYVVRDAQEIWAATNTVDYSLSDLQVALSQDNQLAVARYWLEATVAKEGDKPDERFHLQANYFMTLRYDNGSWKVDTVQREDIFTQNLKSLYSLQLTRETLNKFEKVAKEHSQEKNRPSSVATTSRSEAALSRPSQSEDLIFGDDFNKSNLSSIWHIQSGEWVVEQGKLKAIGQNGVLWLDKPLPDDIAVEVEVQGEFDLNLALAGNGRDNYGYLFDVGGWWNTKAALIERDRNLLEDASIKIKNPQKPYKLRMERQGKLLNCYLDGELIFTYDQAILSAKDGFNRVSFHNWGYPLVFDNLKIYSLGQAAKERASLPPQAEITPSARPRSKIDSKPRSLTGIQQEAKGLPRPQEVSSAASPEAQLKSSVSSLSQDRLILKVKDLAPNHYLRFLSTTPDGKKVLYLDVDKSGHGARYAGASQVCLYDVEWKEEKILLAGNEKVEPVPEVMLAPFLLKNGLPVYGYVKKDSPQFQTGYHFVIGGSQRRIDADFFGDYLHPLKKYSIIVYIMDHAVPYHSGTLAVFKVDLPSSLAFKYGKTEFTSFLIMAEINSGSGVLIRHGPVIHPGGNGGLPVIEMNKPMITMGHPVPVVIANAESILFKGMNQKGELGIYSTSSSRPIEELKDWYTGNFCQAARKDTVLRIVEGYALGFNDSRPRIELYNLSSHKKKVLQADLSATAKDNGGLPIYMLSPDHRELVAVKSTLDAFLVIDLEKDTVSEISLGQLQVDLAGFGNGISYGGSPVARDLIYFTAFEGKPLPRDPSGLYVVRKKTPDSLSSAAHQVPSLPTEKKAVQLSEEETTKPEKIPDLKGIWDTNFGRLVITQDGYKIRGKYEHNKGQIEGMLIGRIIRGKWSEAPSYLPPQDAGEFELTFAEDFKSFTGKWRYGYETQAWDGEWFGSKLK